MTNHETATPKEALTCFIDAQKFPCVGAKASLAKGNLEILTASSLFDTGDDKDIYSRLSGQAYRYRTDPNMFQSFAVIFADDNTLSEREFEQALWIRLQALSDIDVAAECSHDQEVSADPDAGNFSVSFAGAAFFIVGLHPGSSRPARRFSKPTIIFNIHDQFEQMRKTGLYNQLQASISARDTALAGSRNPMLAPHGMISAARQYSGRQVEADWACPFQRKEKQAP